MSYMDKLYFCDPDKNTECKKNNCYRKGGPCRKTDNPEHASAHQTIYQRGEDFYLLVKKETGMKNLTITAEDLSPERLEELRREHNARNNENLTIEEIKKEYAGVLFPARE